MAFRVVRQLHPKGCIPACAISVLRHKGRPSLSEADLMVKMYDRQSAGSGFERLKVALEPHVQVIVEMPGSVVARLTYLTGLGTHVLVTRRLNGDVHCYVAEAVAGEIVYLHDPGTGSLEQVAAATLAADATGDIAFLI